MKIHGNISMQQNFVQQMALDVEENFPNPPVVGRIIFKDLRVYICVEISAGIPVWIPLTHEMTSYVHAQSSGNTTWAITHNLNTVTPSVQVYGTDSKMIIPDAVTITSNNVVTLTFGASFAGRAIILTGSSEGTQRVSYAYEWVQTTPASVWVVYHGLGYYPLTRVFIGQQEVQPSTIVHNSNTQTTITFSTAQVGIARFV